MTENRDAELQQLQKKIIWLEQALKDSQARLDQCLTAVNKNQILPRQSSEEEQRQNEFYTQFRICEANWSVIPEENKQGVLVPPFKMLNTPVTFEMYDLYCLDTHQQPPGDKGWGRENRPVIYVNHFNAVDYAQWLSEKTGWQCELPTEEQWEYACRAGTVTNFWYGDAPDPRMMVMGTGKTMPTPGTRMANPWDLYDMHGNVWEWTATNKHQQFILCGGSWYNKANWLTSTARNIAFPNECNSNWGFRLIRKLENEKNVT